MLIGAQLFSLRDYCDTPEKLKKTFSECHDLGYSVVQLSGACEMDPYELRDISQEFSLPITVTHVAYQRLTDELAKVIEEHKIFGCPVIGIGSMPKVYRDGTFASFKKFYDLYYDISLRIEDAGLKFAYHNHWFEFDKLDNGTTAFDYLTYENRNWDIIADICWIRYGTEDLAGYLRALAGRVRNAHLKDATDLTSRDFCPLGDGVIDVVGAARILRDECGCEFAHIEQDNACKKADGFAEMARSLDFCRKNGI